MNQDDIDRRLGDLLRGPTPPPDDNFAERVLLAARVEDQLAASRRRAWRRAVTDCAAAVAVGSTFFLLSQVGTPDPTGLIALEGPAMAGLVMLLLWGVVALPISGGRNGLRLAG